MMTLAEYSTFVTNKLGQFDALSVSLCKEFAKARYKMIWDAYLWRDTQALITGLAADTTGVMLFPAGVERIIAIRASRTHILTQADSPMLMQLDPTVFERTGEPVAFEDFTDTADGNKLKLRLYPVPQASIEITLAGKRALIPLVNNDDRPIIRNVDNALIAFVQGDMLQRARQYGKAKEAFAEAGALLQSIQNLETQQSARVQRVIPEVEPDAYESYWDDQKSFMLGGGSGQPYNPTVTVPLANEQTELTENLAAAVIPYGFDIWQVYNLVDSNPLAIIPVLTGQTIAHFTVQFAPLPDSGNYVFRYRKATV
jgi:hypothetical protein